MGVSHDERTGSALRQSPDDLRTRVTSDGPTRLLRQQTERVARSRNPHLAAVL
jgi:hypothetical protein